MNALAATAGVIAMAFAILVTYLVSVSGVPFAPLALGQAIIEAMPGWISVPLIEALRYWAQRLLVLGVIGLYLVDGAATGIAAADRRVRTSAVAGLAALPWLATVVLGVLLAGEKIDLASALLGSAIGAAAFFGGLTFLLSAERVSTAAAATRRRALLTGAAAAAALAVLAIVLGGTVRAARAQVSTVVTAARRLRSREPVAAGAAAFEAIDHLEKRITANEDHYTVDTTLIKPRVDASTWQLAFGGEVERPFSISYNELLDMEALERPHTLECISNEIGGDLISTAVWTGVPLADLFARAGPKASAYDVVLTSVDGYTDSIRIAKALDPDTMVAYLMNGFPLPEAHGYPARALIPGIYGMKNVKWLSKIDVVTFDFQGYWMERGWSDIATYNTHVRIDAPPVSTRAVDGKIVIAGIAFAGQRGISRVEVSTDGGASWTAAELEPAPGRHTWVRWRYVWTPAAAARHRLVARATDGTGAVQTSVRRPPFPNGSTGYDSQEISVTA
ncbi:MAG: molybdopterin-dependent oxidoreductase [Chloroflexi bacterium]|nr:molybdopterin-dependent oxidoreductase [Chloroflexota bacterium]